MIRLEITINLIAIPRRIRPPYLPPIPRRSRSSVTRSALPRAKNFCRSWNGPGRSVPGVRAWRRFSRRRLMTCLSGATRSGNRRGERKGNRGNKARLGAHRSAPAGRTGGPLKGSSFRKPATTRRWLRRKSILRSSRTILQRPMGRRKVGLNPRQISLQGIKEQR